MISKIQALLKRPFILNAASFQIGSVGAMLVQAIAGVILARILGPNEFGRYAIVMSMAAIGSVLLGAGATDAIAPVLARAKHSQDDDEIRNVILFLGKFVLITSVIVLILGLTMPIIAQYLYGDASIGWYGLAVLTAAAISTMFFAPTQLGLQVFGYIGRLSILTFSDQFIRQCFVVTLVLSGFGVLGASIGHLFGALIVMLTAGLFWIYLRRSATKLPSIKSLWIKYPQNGRKYLAPTLWVLIDRNLAMLYGAAPVAIAGLFLATTDVSYFKIALGWVTLALAVLSPISTLLNTELARIQIQQPEKLRSRFLQVTLLSVASSAVVTAMAAVVARPVFNLLYGSQYINAVPLVYWLTPFGALFGLGIALGPMWRALNMVRSSIVINLIVLGVGIPLSFVALQQWGALGAVAMVTGWYTISHAVSFLYLFKSLKRLNS